MTTKHGLAIAALMAASPLFAQTAPSADPGEPRTPLQQDRGYDKPSPRTDAINAPNTAVRADLNASVAAETPAPPTVDAQSQAYYEEDIAAYRAAVRAHNRAAVRDEVRYERQQRAYTDAMAAWRFQVAECKRGNTRICNAPSPVPADFY